MPPISLVFGIMAEVLLSICRHAVHRTSCFKGSSLRDTTTQESIFSTLQKHSRDFINEQGNLPPPPPIGCVPFPTPSFSYLSAFPTLVDLLQSPLYRFHFSKVWRSAPFHRRIRDCSLLPIHWSFQGGSLNFISGLQTSQPSHLVAICTDLFKTTLLLVHRPFAGR